MRSVTVTTVLNGWVVDEDPQYIQPGSLRNRRVFNSFYEMVDWMECNLITPE